ncbi:MAG: ThiF family protein [Smithella sp. PtaU1.Bin162]|nr:MAG: ThiF family protein [Smithella sp. PtaU1.Bin162]
MTVEFIPFGEPYSNLSSDNLRHYAAKKTLELCEKNKDFKIIELRHLTKNDGTVSDLIIVECINDQVPSHNPYGIKKRERLALVFTLDKLPEVRALRKDFPKALPHLNDVPLGKPASLCLYFEPWSAVEITWTAHKHLRRILWWLSETAKGKLHRDDQPVERVYFDSPYEIVLPPDFENRIKDQSQSLIFELVKQSTGDFKVIRGIFFPKAKAKNIPQLEILMLELSTVVQRRTESYRKTLGQIHDQLEERGAPFLDRLNATIQEKSHSGLVKNDSTRCLLIFSIPVKSKPDGVSESHELHGLLLPDDLAGLGEKTGILKTHNNKYYPVPLIGQATPDLNTAWREIEFIPIEIKFAITKKFARNASGVDDEKSDFKGVLAGVGALGSAMAELWAKESWGEWTFIDTDYIKPHNIVRHVARDFHIGKLKTDVVKEMVEINYCSDYYSAKAVNDTITNFANPKVMETITTATLLVDATTTLYSPRKLSQEDKAPRAVSVFLTPSGQSSVLLLEDADRSVRLDALEAQYYNSIINSDWGANHLDGHHGTLWVGAGCRDISAIISNEAIQLHAATLARQIRLLKDKPESCIRIWSSNFETGALAVHEIMVQPSLCCCCGDWQVIWDNGVKKQLCEMRDTQLPCETGGIILGYVDQKLKHIYVVDVLKAPLDSEADRTGFTRGTEGLAVVLGKVRRRTANIVDYIGEWHSHPPLTSASPSSIDRSLIKQLADALALDGQPALMVIVGAAGDISLSVKEG